MAAPRSPQYKEHRIPRGERTLYAREYAGDDPAFVMMHGFPDNLLIYKAVAPLLAAAGRRTVVFDFLGYGGSDKPHGYAYSLDGLEDDLEAVMRGLLLSSAIPVAQDASGPTALNWALGHREQVAGIALLNTYYDPSPTLRFPELISLFADPQYRDLTAALAAAPAQLAWVFAFQGQRFYRDAPAEMRERPPTILPIVQRQFVDTPSVLPAFMGLTRGLSSQLEANSQRVAGLRQLTCPISLIWGTYDPFLNFGVAEHLQAHFPHAALSRLPLGHWPQVDGPEVVAQEILAVANQAPTQGMRS